MAKHLSSGCRFDPTHQELNAMRTSVLDRPGIKIPATPQAISARTAPRQKTRLIGRWMPADENPNKMMMVWQEELA